MSRAPKPEFDRQQNVEAVEDDDDDEVLPEAQPSHSRNEVGKEATFRPNAIHVYGLDFLNTEHLKEIFSQFDHKFIEWINDSSANIIFAKASDAKRALDALSFPKVDDAPWRRTPDILVSDAMPQFFLQMRLAATSDAKRVKKAMPKVVPVAPRRGKGGGRRRQEPQKPDDSAGVATKRPRQPLTEEEEAARRKRATRFADWLVSAAAADASSEQAKAKDTTLTVERAAETGLDAEKEVAKREARAQRFKDKEAETAKA